MQALLVFCVYVFRWCRWGVRTILQGIGLGVVCLVLAYPQRVIRELSPHLRFVEREVRHLWTVAHPPPPLADAPAIHWPASHTRISSGFGTRVNPVTGHRHVHRGVDLPMPIGTPIRAARSGTVVRATEDGLNGKYIVLRDRESGLRFAYCHLSVLEVVPGEAVQAGAVVARSGNTGRSTGPHLHFGVWFHERAVDPRRLAVL